MPFEMRAIVAGKTLICTISVPGNIVPWARARMGHGVHFTAPKVRSYQAVIRDYAYAAMEGAGPFDGPCRVSVTATYPWPTSWSAKKRVREGFYKKSKPDADNVLKAIKDALNGIVYTDDARAADVRVCKLYGDNPGLVVEVWALAAAPTTVPLDENSLFRRAEMEAARIP